MLKKLCIVILFCLTACDKDNHAEIFLHPEKGAPISLQSLEGKWVVLNYWASWCKPCIEELPALKNFAEQHAEKVTVFGVNFDPNKSDVLPTPYPALKIDPAKALGLGELKGLPTTYILNPKGQLVKTLFGPQTLATLNGLINTA